MGRIEGPDFAVRRPVMGRVDKTALAIGEPERIEDAAYRASAKGQPCLSCGRVTDTVVMAHVNLRGGRGKGNKASDEHCFPACFECHAAFDNQARGEAGKIEWLVARVLPRLLPRHHHLLREVDPELIVRFFVLPALSIRYWRWRAERAEKKR